MNILSLSNLGDIHTALVPLFVLNQRYFKRMPEINNAFLLPEMLHERYLKSGINVLPIDYSLTDIDESQDNYDKAAFYKNFISNINSAFEQSDPDAIIETGEPLSTLIAEKKGIPRISIQSTGLFRSIGKEFRNPSHMHSMEKTPEGKMNMAYILNPQKKAAQLQINQIRGGVIGNDINYISNYLNAKTKIIPGIPSIERLPENIENRESYFYSGPLLTEDAPSEKLKSQIEEFKNRNKNRRLVFIAAGQLEEKDVTEILLYLLNNEYAVISTAYFSDIAHQYTDRIISDPVIPLNYISSQADLIIHNCAHGMYHYPILNLKPAITLGTQCYDREDVALRLQEMGLSKHVPSPQDDNQYMSVFLKHLDDFEKGSLFDLDKTTEVKEEIFRTMLDFDIAGMLEYTYKH